LALVCISTRVPDSLRWLPATSAWHAAALGGERSGSPSNRLLPIVHNAAHVLSAVCSILSMCLLRTMLSTC
jgi:hypothetical protein